MRFYYSTYENQAYKRCYGGAFCAWLKSNRLCRQHVIKKYGKRLGKINAGKLGASFNAE